MVTAALLHCLINTIVPEIMVSDIYLGNIMDLVIVHGVDNYPVWRSVIVSESVSLGPRRETSKVVYLQWPWLPWVRVLHLHIFSLCGKGTISLALHGWHIWVGYLKPAHSPPSPTPPKRPRVLRERAAQPCHFMFHSYFQHN